MMLSPLGSVVGVLLEDLPVMEAISLQQPRAICFSEPSESRSQVWTWDCARDNSGQRATQVSETRGVFRLTRLVYCPALFVICGCITRRELLSEVHL